jgi:hypothetical protein
VLFGRRNGLTEKSLRFALRAKTTLCEGLLFLYSVFADVVWGFNHGKDLLPSIVLYSYKIARHGTRGIGRAVEF